MNDTVLHTVSYSLPEAVHRYLQIVSTTYFGSPRTQGKKRRVHPSGVAAARAKAGSGELVTVLQSCDVSVAPSYVRLLYKTMGYVPAAVDLNALGIVGFNEQYPSTRDSPAFMEEFRTEGDDATFAVVQNKGGGYDPNDSGIEASLNLQFAEAMAYPTPITGS